MNGVYSPGMLQVSLSNHVPTFALFTRDAAYQRGVPLWNHRDLPPLVLWNLPPGAFFTATGWASLFLLPLQGSQTSVGNSRKRKLPVFLFAFAVYGLELARIGLCLPYFFLVLTNQNYFVILSKQNIIVSLLFYKRKKQRSEVLWSQLLVQSYARGRTKAVPALESFQTLLNVSFWSCPRCCWTDSVLLISWNLCGAVVFSKISSGNPNIHCFARVMLWAMAEGISILKAQ